MMIVSKIDYKLYYENANKIIFICIILLKYHVFSTYSRNNLFIVIVIMIPYIIMKNRFI